MISKHTLKLSVSLLKQRHSLVHIQRLINGVRQRRNVNSKLHLHFLHSLLVFLGGYEGNSKTLGSETASTTHAVQVLVCCLREIVIDDHIDLIHINSSAEKVGRHQNAVIEALEALVVLQTVLRAHVSRDAGVVELVAVQNVRQLSGARAVPDKDDNLIELQSVQQVHQLLGLLVLRLSIHGRRPHHRSSDNTAADRAASDSIRPARSSEATTNKEHPIQRPS